MNSIIICDDREQDRKELRTLLKEYLNVGSLNYEIFEFSSAEELLGAWEKRKDAVLCFLDIFMEQMTGVELARKMRSCGYEGEIVFTTTSTEFAMESYDVEALYYLVKPYSLEKIQRMRELYQKKLERKKKETEQCLLIKLNGSLVKVPYSQIEYIESQNTILQIHLSSGEIYTQYGKLSEMEEKLNLPCFLRCHQSYLINMDHVKRAEKVFVMGSGDTVLIRQKKCHQIKELYFQYIIRKAY